MGKGKRKSRKTRKWRNSNETGEEAMKVIRAQHDDGQLRATPDDHLFVIDTKGGSETAAALRVAKTSSKSSHHSGIQPRKRPRRCKARIQKQENAFDLWSNKDGASSSKGASKLAIRAKTRNSKAAKTRVQIKTVAVPPPGLSYNPSKGDHQDAVAKAVAKEIMRADRLASERMPRQAADAPGGDDDDDDDSGDEEEDSGAGECQGNKPVSRFKKKTRADRNRAKRVAKEEAERRAKKETKLLMHQIGCSKAITKGLAEEEDLQSRRRSNRLRLQQEALTAPATRSVRVGGKRRRHEPMSEVALTEELHGSLRKMKAQGHILKDRWFSLLERNEFELGDKSRVRKLRRQQSKKHKSYGKEHWGVEALEREAAKRRGGYEAKRRGCNEAKSEPKSKRRRKSKKR